MAFDGFFGLFGSEKETKIIDVEGFERSLEKELSPTLQDRLYTLQSGIKQNHWRTLPEDTNLLNRILDDATAEGFADIDMLCAYIQTGKINVSDEEGPEVDPENTNITTLDALRELVSEHSVVHSNLERVESKEWTAQQFVDSFDIGSYEVDDTLPELLLQLLEERKQVLRSPQSK